MAATPLAKSLEGMPEPRLIRAPEWSSQDWKVLLARSLAALGLFALSATIILVTLLSGDDDADQQVVRLDTGARVTVDITTLSSSVLFEQRAVEASQAASQALTSRRASRGNLIAAKQSLRDARAARPPPPQAQIQSRVSAVNNARTAFIVRQRAYQQRVAERAAALADYNVSKQGTDTSLAKLIGLGVLALVGLVGAAAVLAPRRSQLMTISTEPEHPAGGGGGQSQLRKQGQPPALTGAVESGADVPSAGKKNFVAAEPAVTGGLFASIALIAGLFGIQHYEGVAENLINIVLPVIPLVGALFVRQRVAARANIPKPTRDHLFNE